MKISKILLVVFCLGTAISSAQYYYRHDQKAMDSLETVLPSSKDTSRIDLLNQLAEYYAHYHPDLFPAVIWEADSFSKKIQYKRGEAMVLYNYGYKAYLEGDYINSIDFYQQAINLFEEIGNKQNLAKTYQRMAVVLFWSETDRLGAKKYMAQAIKLYKEIGNLRDEAYTSLLMSGGILRMGLFEEGIILVKRYLEITDSIGDVSLFRGIAYAAIAACYKGLEQFDMATTYYHQSISTFDDRYVEERSCKSEVSANLGDHYFLKNNTDSAIYYFRQAIELDRSISNSGLLAIHHFYLAKTYNENNKNWLAIKHCDSSLYYAQLVDSTGNYYSIDSLKYYIGDPEELFYPVPKTRRSYYSWIISTRIYKMLTEYYNQNDQYEKSAVYYKKWLTHKDKINHYTKDKEQMELQLKYETEKKEKRIEMLSEENRYTELQLKQNRTFLFGLSGIIFLIILMGLILLRQNKIKSQQKTLMLEQRLLRSQMNPHFIFNSLSSIQGFMMEKDTRTASKYLSKFAKLIRNILDNSSEEYVPLDKEISTIENYLELQKVRYEGKFDYSIEVDESIEPESVIIPPMLAQPFIENAIEHGIKHKGSKGNIKVGFKLNKQSLIYVVEDDGIGREKAQEIQKKQNTDHKSLATSITQERIKVINKKSKHKITLEIIDLKNDEGKGTGTKVVFKVPV